jgi:NTP pyrophosphatase (non-canonical NTP hydrolase)
LDALNWDASAPYSERTVVAKVTSEGIEVVSDVASREPPVTSRILQWATDRNFWKGSTPKDQVLKLVQEFGEYCESLDKDKCVKDDIGDMFVVLTVLCEQLGTTVEGALAEYLLNAGGSGYGYEQDTLMLGSQVGDLSDVICKGKDAKSAIGDLITSLLHLATDNDYSLYDAAEHSYKEIKDRKGEMRDGVFIKEGDL